MTYEEVKKIRENPTASDVDSSLFKKLSTMIDEAIEKQIPKKPNIHGYRAGREVNTISYAYPVCNERISKDKYCNNCGQALDWSE